MNVNLKTQISKQTMLVVGLALGGLLFGLIGYLVLVSPAKARLSTVSKELDVARTSLITAENTPPPPKQPPAHASDIFRMTKAMPNTDDWPGVLIALSKLAQQSKVELQDVTPGTDSPGAGFTEIPVTVTIHGTYASVTRFVANVRRTAVVTPTQLKVNGRMFVAGGVTLSTPDGKSVDASLTLDAFAYAPAVAAPPTGTTTTTTATTP